MTNVFNLKIAIRSGTVWKFDCVYNYVMLSPLGIGLGCRVYDHNI